MKLKPISATDALRGRQLLPPSHNRFDAFRSRENSNVRERSTSAKRKASDDGQAFSQPQVTKKSNTGNSFSGVGSVDLGKLESLNKKVGNLYNISAKINEEVAKTSVDPALESVLRSLCEFMDTTIALQEEIVNSLTVSSLSFPKPSFDFTPYINQQPTIRVSDETVSEVSDSDMDTGPTSYSKVAARRPLRQRTLQPIRSTVPPTPVDPKVKKFQDAIKAAEKSTLVFNLDMGNTKILNEKSILSKATLALTAKAAVVEGKPPNRPSAEVVEALDDVLSLASGATIFGKQTKAYRNNKKQDDPRNGTFFTVPVRYEFKDREQKFAAETVLRERCKVECTTPYPTIVRHCIKKVIEHVRNDYPEEFIKVQVDPKKFCLKVSRRTVSKEWFKFDDDIPLPEIAYNINARSVPDDFVMPPLPTRVRREPTPPPDKSGGSQSEEQ